VNEAQGGWLGNRRPGQEKNRPNQYRLPGGHQDHDGKTRHGNQVEDQERALGPDAVGQIAAGKRVESRQQVVQAVQQSNGERSSAQGHQIDGQEALRHALTHPEQHHHEQQADGAALEAQEALEGFQSPGG